MCLRIISTIQPELRWTSQRSHFIKLPECNVALRAAACSASLPGAFTMGGRSYRHVEMFASVDRQEIAKNRDGKSDYDRCQRTLAGVVSAGARAHSVRWRSSPGLGTFLLPGGLWIVSSDPRFFRACGFGAAQRQFSPIVSRGGMLPGGFVREAGGPPE